MSFKHWIRESFVPNSGTFHSFIMLKALMVYCLLAVLATNVGGSPCAPFSCGDLRNISYPFRLLGDPPECGVEAYELICNGPKATIKINTGTYFVTEINYSNDSSLESYFAGTLGSFRVMDANLDMNSSCPLPQWNEIPYSNAVDWPINSDADDWPIVSGGRIDLSTYEDDWACFVNCSRAITDNSMYQPVTCLGASNSYVYVFIRDCVIGDLEPSCGYLGMIPLDGQAVRTANSSYGHIRQMMRKGFHILFPMDGIPQTSSQIIRTCLNDSIR
jgi:hypothetical protein